jgi:hypothetical protein
MGNHCFSLNRHFELITFDEFMKKFPDFAFRGCERFPAQRSSAVNAPQGLAIPQFRRSQVPFLFQTLQERIKTSRADAISVTRQFLYHPQAEDRTFDRMVQYMKPDQA